MVGRDWFGLEGEGARADWDGHDGLRGCGWADGGGGSGEVAPELVLRVPGRASRCRGWCWCVPRQGQQSGWLGGYWGWCRSSWRRMRWRMRGW